MGILPTLTCEYLLPDAVPWSIGNAAVAHISHGRYMFFVQANATISSLKDIDSMEITAINIIFGIVHAIVYLTRGVVGPFINLGVMMSVASLCGAVCTFYSEAVGEDDEDDIDVTEEETAEALTFFSIVPPVPTETNSIVAPCQEERNESNETAEGRVVNKLVARYIQLKTLSDNINQGIGGIVFFFLVEWTMYYSVSFNKIFLPGKWNKKFRSVCGLLWKAIIFTFSTNVYLKVRTRRISI